MVKEYFFEYEGWFNSVCDANKFYLPPLQEPKVSPDAGEAEKALATKVAERAQFENRLIFVSITVKKRILDKKTDMIDVLANELIAFGIEGWTIKKLKQRVEFAIPVMKTHEARREYVTRMIDYLHDCVIQKWGKAVVFEKDTLQALLMERLKKPEFRLKATVYHAERHGASDTLDLMNLIDAHWSLRY